MLLGPPAREGCQERSPRGAAEVGQPRPGTFSDGHRDVGDRRRQLGLRLGPRDEVVSAIVGFRNGEEPADLLKGMPRQLDQAIMAALRGDQA
jgi:hypothetical protein